MGVGSHADVVHVIDFGLSKEYRSPNTHAHIPFKKGLGFTGTAAFASVNSHLGLELGRRDDLESLAYVLFYFLWGFLPWQGFALHGDDIVKSKQGITTLPLFQGLPLELRTFFDHCRSLSFDGRPNYDHIFHLFNSLLVKEGFQDNVEFDWDLADAKILDLGRDVKIPSTICQNDPDPSHKRRMG
jgi:serine/threonine protein kinase